MADTGEEKIPTARRWDDRLGRLDARILQNGAVSLYWSHEILVADVAWLREHGYVVHTFDCASWNAVEQFHTDIGRALGFPDWYGRNLNAFNDSLSDIEISESRGVALVFERYDLFAEQHPDVAWHILDIIEVQARRFLMDVRRLIALVQSDDPAIRFAPVGARPIMWNPREWLNEHRGL